ncbi:MAG TPA: hypothetical protein VFH73_29095, partial [Polyangia bacterium]|nr:hypothetical protein [Polyangia bacterium]
MTTKPASGSSEPIDDGIEDSIDDSLDELVLQAKEASLENPVKSKNGSHEASSSGHSSDGPAAEVATATMSDNSTEIALDIAEAGADDDAAADDTELIPIPDVVSADSPDNVPRGGVAGDALAAALPVAERDVVVSEDEVRVKVEPVPSDDASTTSQPAAEEPAPAAAAPQDYDLSPIVNPVLDPIVDANAESAQAQDDNPSAEGGETSENDHSAADSSDDLTENMRAGELRPLATTPVVGHPSLTDEAAEELTPIEPYASAMRAASMSNREKPEAGLATQAREERDRALRQSSGAPSPRTPPTTASHPVATANVHFDDSENELVLDDDTETETPSDLHRLSPGRDQLGARGSTPPQGYPGRRLPTPSPGILQGPAGSGAYAALATNP